MDLSLGMGTPGSAIDHDIAILEMKEEVDLNTYTPACLASASDENTFDATGKLFTAVGWGDRQPSHRTGIPEGFAAAKTSPDTPYEAQLTGRDCGDDTRKDIICTDPTTGKAILSVRINT